MTEKIKEYSIFNDESIPNDEPSGQKSIHSTDSIKFHKDELKVDAWVISVLEDKYKILFPDLTMSQTTKVQIKINSFCGKKCSNGKRVVLLCVN